MWMHSSVISEELKRGHKQAKGILAEVWQVNKDAFQPFCSIAQWRVQQQRSCLVAGLIDPLSG